MKNFKINASYEQEFKNLWRNLVEEYPQELFDLDGIGDDLDLSKFSRKFFTNKNATADVSIDANANVGDKSIISYGDEWGKPLERFNSYYLLWDLLRKIYDYKTAEEAVRANLIGDIYINDFHGISTSKPYCFNYSTYDIATQGLSFVEKIKSGPPKYLYGFKSQVENFIIVASKSTLGATGIADFLLVTSLYVENIINSCGDGHFKFASIDDCWNYVKETLISFIYTINQPMRGTQAAFTNVSIYDDLFLKELEKNYSNPITGNPLNLDIVRKVQNIFIDCMNEEMRRTPITFPVVTACFSTDDNKQIVDKEFLKTMSEKSAEFAFINFYMGKSSTLSSCCRLRSSMETDYFNSFGSGGVKIGSLGVCTINLPRLAFKHKDNKQEFFKDVERLVILTFKINHAKRKLVEKRVTEGYHPLYSHNFININKQYSTCGVNGFNECIEIMGYKPLEQNGIDFGIELIDCINNINDTLGKEYKVPVNCEQIPAETVSIKLAQKDLLFGFNKIYTIYSNQFIPLTVNADLLDRIRLQGIYDSKFSGGAICHLNVEKQISDSKYIEQLLEHCASLGVIYFAINYNLQRCKNDHMSVGKGNVCSICGEAIIDNYTRIVGFLSNTKNWHKVRREKDYPNRVFYGKDK